MSRVVSFCCGFRNGGSDRSARVAIRCINAELGSIGCDDAKYRPAADYPQQEIEKSSASLIGRLATDGLAVGCQKSEDETNCEALGPPGANQHMVGQFGWRKNGGRRIVREFRLENLSSGNTARRHVYRSVPIF